MKYMSSSPCILNCHNPPLALSNSQLIIFSILSKGATYKKCT